jgi:hypothetical protein
MEENLKWLWMAFSIGWALHILYVYTLGAREKTLREQVRNLRAQLEDREDSPL